MILKHFWLLSVWVFLNVTGTECHPVPSQIERHDTISYTVHHDPLGNISSVEVWVDSIHVPLIDGIPCWQDMRGYKLHVWHNPEPQKNPSSQQHLPHQTSNFTSCKEPAATRYQPPKTSSLPILGNNQRPTQEGMYAAIRTNTNQNSNDIALRSQYAYFADKYARMRYHMTFDQHMDLMSPCRYEKFTDTLLHHIYHSNISDDAAWELFNKFAESKWLHGNDFVIGKQKIKAALETRKQRYEEQEQDRLQRIAENTKHQVRQEEHKKILIKTEHILQNSEHSSSYQGQRQQALQETINNNCRLHTLDHSPDPKVAGLLKAYGVSTNHLKNVQANTMQHQLINEVTQTYKKVAKAVFEFGLRSSCLVPETIGMAATAYDVTMLDNVVIAAHLSDITDFMAEVTLSVARAGRNSLQGLVTFFQEADQIPHKVAEMTHAVGAIAAFCGRAMTVAVGSIVDSSQKQHQRKEAFLRDCNKAITLCSNHWNQLSAQKKIEQAAQVVFDVIVFEKMLLAISRLIRCVGAIDVAVAADAMVEEISMGEIIQEASAATALESAVATTMGELETGLMSLMETELAVAKCGINFSQIADIPTFIEKFHALKGIVAASDRALIKQVDSALKRLSKQLDRHCIKNLTKEYAQRAIEDKTVYAGLDHILNAELKLTRCEVTGNMVLDIAGGHLHGAYEAIEKAGLIKIIKIETLPTNVLKYHMQDVFTGRIIERFTFPKSWSATKVCEATWSLYESAGNITKAKNTGAFLKKGFIDGVEMQIYYTTKKDLLIIEKIATSYPFIEKF